MRRTFLALVALAMPLLAAFAALAVDTIVSNDAPDLASPRALIKQKDFKAALAELAPLVEAHQHPDVFNLYAFSLRKTGDRKQATTFYAKALELDPLHRGALEYQGEMFVENGEMERARENLARLVALCPSGCEERTDLEQAIAAAERKKK